MRFPLPIFACLAAAHERTGGVYSAGNNNNGQLGDGTTASTACPTDVSAFAGKVVTAIAAGGAHMLLRTADGVAYAVSADPETTPLPKVVLCPRWSVNRATS